MIMKKKFGLFSSSVLYGLGGAAQRLISFFLMPLFTHYLSPADYGVVGLLSSLPALLLPIFSFGLSASIGVCYFATEKQSERLVIIQSSRFITHISALLLLTIAFAGLDFITQIFVSNLAYRTHALVTIFTVSLSIVCLPLQLEQQFAGRPIEFVAISLVGALLTSFSCVVAIVFFKLGSLGMLIGSLLGQLLVWILLLGARKINKLETPPVNWPVILALLRQGLPMLPSFILLFVLQNGVRWPLERIHGVDAVGLYSLGSSFGATLTLFTSGFVTAWTPWAMGYAQYWEDGRYTIARRFTQYFIVGGFIVLLFFCIAQPIVLMMTPPSYFHAWIVVGLTAASNFLMSLFSLLLPPVYIAKQVSLVLIAQAIAALSTIGSIYLLIDFGVLGASLAVFIGAMVLVIAQIMVNVKLTTILPIPFEMGRFFQIISILTIASYATFWMQVTDLFYFLIEAILITIFVGIILFKWLPDKQLLINKILKGL